MGSSPHPGPLLHDGDCLVWEQAVPQSPEQVPCHRSAQGNNRMSDYWIDVYGCDRVLAELRDQILDVLNDYDAAQEALKDTRVHLCTSYERADMTVDAEQLDTEIVSFADVRMKDHVDGVISHVQRSFASMMDVMYYYTSGDAEMVAAANQGGPGEFDIPELRHRGEAPEQSVIPETGYDARISGQGTEQPFQTSYDHRPAE